MSDRPVNILLVEDEAQYAELLRQILTQAQHFQVSCAARLSEAVALLGQQVFDSVLLDLSLPDSQGLATFQRIQAGAPSVPVIVLTGNDDENIALEAVREGAQDYLLKSQADARSLVRAIRYAIERKKTEAALRQALSDLQKSNEQLELLQAQLVQAEKLEAVSTFASGVAHEVKNPLQTIILGIDYLNNHLKAGDKNTALVLGDMSDAVRRADGVMHAMVEFSLPRPKNVQPEDLSLIAAEALRTVEEELTKSHARLSKDLAATLPPITLDARTLKHVLINLLLQALRNMPAGGLLEVRTFCRPALPTSPKQNGEKEVVIEIQHPSCPAENAPPSGEQTALPKANPTPSGLGFTVLKKIIELYSGAFEVISSETGQCKYSISFKA